MCGFFYQTERIRLKDDTHPQCGVFPKKKKKSDIVMPLCSENEFVKCMMFELTAKPEMLQKQLSEMSPAFLTSAKIF